MGGIPYYSKLRKHYYEMGSVRLSGEHTNNRNINKFDIMSTLLLLMFGHFGNVPDLLKFWPCLTKLHHYIVYTTAKGGKAPTASQSSK